MLADNDANIVYRSIRIGIHLWPSTINNLLFRQDKIFRAQNTRFFINFFGGRRILRINANTNVCPLLHHKY